MGKDGFLLLTFPRTARPCYIQFIFHRDIPTDLGETSGLGCGKFVFFNTWFLQSPGEFNTVSQGDWRMIKWSETAKWPFPYSLSKNTPQENPNPQQQSNKWIINNAGAFVKSLFISASSTPWPSQVQTVKDSKAAPDWQITL